MQSSIATANHTCCSQDNSLCIKTAAGNLFRSLQHNPLSEPSRELMRGEGKKGKVWTSTASHRDLDSFFSRTLPQSVESWLSSPSSSRWREVWGHLLPGIQTMPLLQKSQSDHRGTWWSWACLPERGEEAQDTGGDNMKTICDTETTPANTRKYQWNTQVSYLESMFGLCQGFF